jgi:hypothetical protein
LTAFVLNVLFHVGSVLEMSLFSHVLISCVLPVSSTFVQQEKLVKVLFPYGHYTEQLLNGIRKIVLAYLLFTSVKII